MNSAPVSVGSLLASVARTGISATGSGLSFTFPPTGNAQTAERLLTLPKGASLCSLRVIATGIAAAGFCGRDAPSAVGVGMPNARDTGRSVATVAANWGKQAAGSEASL